MKNQPIAMRGDVDYEGVPHVTVFVRVAPKYDTVDDHLKHVEGAVAQARVLADRLVAFLEKANIKARVEKKASFTHESYWNNVHLNVRLRKGSIDEEGLKALLERNSRYAEMLRYDENDFWEGG